MLVGDVAMLAEAIIRKTCKELDIRIIDMAVNPDHVHLVSASNLRVTGTILNRKATLQVD